MAAFSQVPAKFFQGMKIRQAAAHSGARTFPSHCVFRKRKNVRSPKTWSDILPAFYNPMWDRSLLASIAEYHNFSPVLVTEIRFGYQLFDQQVPNNGLAFTGLNFFPNIKIQELGAEIGPGSALPFELNTWSLGVNTTWNLGHHTVKFGTDGRRYIGPMNLNNLGIGSFGFSSLSGFLLN